MTVHHADPWLTIHGGDCREVMRTLEPESVHMVCTSPPYWGLRDYGTASWDGGDADCDHRMKNPETDQRTSTLGANGSGLALDNAAYQHGKAFKTRCGKCGARRIDAQIGLEATPEEYVATMVDVFREVRRVLRSDGTVWLNLGDSYAASMGQRKETDAAGPKQMTKRGLTGSPSRSVDGLKPKDLVGIPWRVAFALQADGWYLRSDIVWAKPNPMPESVTDRPTKAHEYLFLLTKSARYFYDADAVRELGSANSHGGAPIQSGPKYQGVRGDAGTLGLPSARNLRSVWTIATAPYPGAHFATFPPKLVEPCVKAGTSERGVCPDCGAPWARVVERSRFTEVSVAPKSRVMDGMRRNDGDRNLGGQQFNKFKSLNPDTTTGWRPTCDHGDDPVPATVMDPFAGSGTVGMVAQSLSRRAVLIDLNPEYLAQCLGRNRQMPLGVGS